MGDPQIPDIDQLLSMDAMGRVAMLQATDLFKKRRYREAVVLLADFIDSYQEMEDDPDLILENTPYEYLDAWQLLLHALSLDLEKNQGDYAELQSYAERAIGLFREYGPWHELYHYKGKSLFKQKKYPEAIAAFHKGLTSEMARYFNPLAYDLAVTYAVTGQTDKALVSLWEAVRADAAKAAEAAVDPHFDKLRQSKKFAMVVDRKIAFENQDIVIQSEWTEEQLVNWLLEKIPGIYDTAAIPAQRIEPPPDINRGPDEEEYNMGSDDIGVTVRKSIAPGDRGYDLILISSYGLPLFHSFDISAGEYEDNFQRWTVLADGEPDRVQKLFASLQEFGSTSHGV